MTYDRGGIIQPAPWAHGTALALMNFGGFVVRERPDILRYDEIIVDRVARVIDVGERKHLAYLLDMKALKDAMRKDVDLILSEWSAKIGVA